MARRSLRERVEQSIAVLSTGFSKISRNEKSVDASCGRIG